MLKVNAIFFYSTFPLTHLAYRVKLVEVVVVVDGGAVALNKCYMHCLEHCLKSIRMVGRDGPIFDIDM